MDLWPFVPQREFTESLDWLTDVIPCKGAEQRLSLRALPRPGYQYSVVLDPAQFSRAKMLARGLGDKEILLPLWGELTRLGPVASGTTTLTFDTRFAQYVAGRQLVVFDEDDHYELATIEVKVDTDLVLADPLAKTYTNALVMPVQTVRFAQPLEGSRSSNEYFRATARFSGTDATEVPDLALYPTLYLGHEVVTDRAFLIGDLRERFLREAEVVDSSLGVVWAGPTLTYATQDSVMSWDTLTREELWKVRSWLYTRRGKWKAFWLPSWNNDLEVVQNISSTDTEVIIKAVGYSNLDTTRDIMIQTTCGQRYLRRIIGATPGIGGTEVLELAEPIGFTHTVAEITLACFLTLYRFDADRVEIRHRAARGASVSIPITEVPT